MMMLNLRRTVIAVPAALLLFAAAAHAQELPQGESAAEATFSGQGITAAHSVTHIGMDPLSPNVLKFGENINFTFNYTTTQVGGVRIFIRPMTIDPVTGADILTPNYAACGSPLYATGSSTGTCSFTITDLDASVDKIRIQMWDANQTVKLFQIKLPVAYRFR